MKILLLDEAKRRFEAEDNWWRENRDDPRRSYFASLADTMRSVPLR